MHGKLMDPSRSCEGIAVAMVGPAAQNWRDHHRRPSAHHSPRHLTENMNNPRYKQYHLGSTQAQSPPSHAARHLPHRTDSADKHNQHSGDGL